MCWKGLWRRHSQLHALRELHKLGFVEAYCWCDTRDNVANCLTKLKPDGGLDLAGLKDFYRGGGWEPTHPFRWHSARLTDPQTYVVTHLPLPPPSTKSLEDNKLTESNQKELASMLPSLQYRFAYVTLEIELPMWTAMHLPSDHRIFFVLHFSLP